MKISIVIPIYNVEKYLAECLDSVINQSYSDIEVICVNDGSTDTSGQILNTYQEKNENLIVIEQENKGLSNARNRGIEAATGDCICFLDSDDKLADKDAVSFIAKEMQNDALDILYYDAGTFFEDEQIKANNRVYVDLYKCERSYGEMEHGYKMFATFIRNRNLKVAAYCQCVRKDFLKETGIRFPDGLLYEDNLFSFMTSMKAGKVKHVNRIVVSRRIRSGSIMQSEPKLSNLKSIITIYMLSVKFWRANYRYEISDAVYLFFERLKGQILSIYDKLPSKEEKHKVLNDEAEKALLQILEIRERTTPQLKILYHMLHQGSKVAIYGAGARGKQVYNTLVHDNYVDVSGVVDRNAANMQEYGMVAMVVDALKYIEYDKLLISIEDKQTADEAVDNLVKKGIVTDTNKIILLTDIWRSSETEIYSKSYEEQKLLRRILTETKNKIYLFMLPEHGNMGDYAIGIAEKKFFGQYFNQYNLLSVSTNEWNAMKDIFLATITQEDIIVITGGGFIGDMWPSGSVCHEIADSFPQNRIMFMPNTLTYADGIDDNLKVEEDLKHYFTNDRLRIAFREKISYEKCCTLGFADKCVLAPDMALLLDYSGNREISNKNEKKALLCFRTDQEKIYDGIDAVEEALKCEGYACKQTDIHLYKYISQERSVECLERKIREMQEYSMVVTDRLHGMILARDAGVPVIAFDNSTHKVRGVYDTWLKDEGDVRMCEGVENLQKQIMIFSGQDVDKQNGSFQLEFEALRDYIDLNMMRSGYDAYGK